MLLQLFQEAVDKLPEFSRPLDHWVRILRPYPTPPGTRALASSLDLTAFKEPIQSQLLAALRGLFQEPPP